MQIKNTLRDKKNIIFALAIGFVFGVIMSGNGFYTSTNTNNGAVITNKFTGKSCIVRYTECIEIERTK